MTLGTLDCFESTGIIAMFPLSLTAVLHENDFSAAFFVKFAQMLHTITTSAIIYFRYKSFENLFIDF